MHEPLALLNQMYLFLSKDRIHTSFATPALIISEFICNSLNDFQVNSWKRSSRSKFPPHRNGTQLQPTQCSYQTQQSAPIHSFIHSFCSTRDGTQGLGQLIHILPLSHISVQQYTSPTPPPKKTPEHLETFSGL
jgi:hypothetical protein